MNVLVLGGRGFIGRHVVRALRAHGHAVVVGSRRAVALADGAACVTVRFEERPTAASWLPLLDRVDVVVNCVGILRERPGESYDDVHRRAPVALCAACGQAGVRRFVHVSALGLDGTPRDGFLASKRAAEEAMQRPPLPVTIVRPSLLDGEGGFGARWLRRIARWPVHVVPAGACGRIAALDVRDLGAAIARLCEDPGEPGLTEIELGGPDERTLAEHLAALRRLSHQRPAVVVRLPMLLARGAAWLCDRLHVSPYSAGHLELLGRDNVPRANALPALLGRVPRTIGIAPGAARPPRSDRHRGDEAHVGIRA